MVRSKGFTLIELLIVIAIIAFLSVIVILIINPVQLLAQSRDGRRLSDLASLNNAVLLDLSSGQAVNLGTTGICYASSPATSLTACTRQIPGTTQVQTSTTPLQNSGQGWIPLNLASNLGALPVDPLNTASNFFAYTGSNTTETFILTATLESTKYASVAQDIGGSSSSPENVYAVGSMPWVSVGTSTASTTPPSTPTNLAVATTTTSTVSLSWTSSTPGTYAIAGYYIARNSLNVGSTASTTYTDTGLTASTTYAYTVQAYDVQGSSSAQSGSVNGTTQAAGSSWPTLAVDLVVPMNTSASGTALTAAIMNAGSVAGTSCSVGSTCTWGTPPGSGFSVGGDQPSLANLGPVAVNGGSTYAAGTLNHNNVAFNDDIAGPGNNEYVNMSGSAGNATDVSEVVGILTPPIQPASGSDMDMVILWANNGDYAVTQFNPHCTGTTYGVRIETGHPTLHSGCITVSPQTDYYFAMSSNFTTGVATLYAYTTSGTLVGSTTVTSGATGSTFNSISIGNNEGGFEPGTSYFQNMMVNWTNASSGPLFW